jgi:hypothetical protein
MLGNNKMVWRSNPHHLGVEISPSVVFHRFPISYEHQSCNKLAHELAVLAAVEAPVYHNAWVPNVPNVLTTTMFGDYGDQS